MSQKQRYRTQLLNARAYSEQLLETFKTPQDWIHQVHPAANHALWFAGHMGVVDNFMIRLIDPSRAKEMPDFQERFSMGSQPVSDAAAYPPVETVLAYMRDRRQTLLSLLDAMGEEDLGRRTPEGAPDFLKDYQSIFETVAWHEGLHSGQVSVASRSLGHPPVVGS